MNSQNRPVLLESLVLFFTKMVIWTDVSNSEPS